MPDTPTPSKSIASTAAKVALGSAAALVVFYWDSPIGARVRLTQKLKRVSGGLPIIGDALTVLNNLHRFHEWTTELAQKSDNSPTLISIPLQPPTVFVNDPKSVEHILKTKFSIYEKGPFFYEKCDDVLGHGIFNVDGDLWKSQRKTAANIFSVKNFKEFVGIVFVEEMEALHRKCDAVIEKNGGVVDLQDIFFRYTLDGFCKIGFGIDLDCMEQDTPVPFASAFDKAQTRMQRRFVDPLWKLQEMLTSVGSEQKKNVAIIRDFGMNIIRERRKEQEEQGSVDSESHDLLTLLMNVKDEHGNLPTDDQLCDYIINFIIAGRDTTAQALSWTFLMLHLNPLSRSTLLKEIHSTLGSDITVQPTYDQIKTMTYANAVFHETLRLYPSVPTENKSAMADDVLPDGTIIPKGTVVAWSPYTMGRTPEIWGPDASAFRPERWLEMKRQPSPFDYPVFNAGPRVCLGKSMAELEGVFVMVSPLRQYHVEVINAENVTYANSLTLPIKDGLKVKLTKRETFEC